MVYTQLLIITCVPLFSVYANFVNVFKCFFPYCSRTFSADSRLRNAAVDLYCSLYDNLTPTCVPEGVGGLLYVLVIVCIICILYYLLVYCLLAIVCMCTLYMFIIWLLCALSVGYWISLLFLV